MRRCCVLALLAVASSLALAQSVSYEKFRLKNGMTVILHVDKTAPQATINTWFRVGSKDEAERRSGFAHLFEHLMFMGTERVPDNQFDKLMETVGGQNNASTSSDRTNYYSSGPNHILKTLLWLDADRLQDIGRMMDQKKLDLQREVVRNERRQGVEIVPYGRAYESLGSLLYPKAHPYHTSVIGSHEDLEAATVNDVKSFFATYYVPSNASLVVAGDFDPVEIRKYIESTFGVLPRGNDVARKAPVEAKLTGTKKVTMTDSVKFPKVVMGWHTPAKFQPGDVALQIAGSLLGQGSSSLLYEELVTKQGIASEISSYQDSSFLGSVFYIDATAAPGVSPDKLVAEIQKVIDRFAKTGPTKEALAKAKKEIELQTYSRIESLSARADALNEYEFYFNEPNSFKKVLQMSLDQTQKSIQEAFQKSIANPNRLELTVLPEFEIPKASALDAKPAIGAESAYQPPASKPITLANGSAGTYWHGSMVPLTQLEVVFKGGSAMDPAGKEGLADLAISMLMRGAKGQSGSQFEQQMSSLGASMNATAGLRSIRISLGCTSESLDRATALMLDALSSPSLLESEWAALKKEHIAELESEADDNSQLASQVSSQEFFGPNHISGRRSQGTVESVSKITLQDVREFLAKTITSANATLFAAGNLSSEEFVAKTDASWKTWKGGTKLPAIQATAVEDSPLRVVIVDKPGAAQTVVRWTMAAPSLGSPDRTALEAIGTVLGGSFTSRLNQNLRENKGYTYGIGSSFNFQPEYGTFGIRTSVRTDVTGASIAEILKELNAIREGNISTDEASKARSVRRADTVEGLSTASGIVNNAAGQSTLGRNLGDLANDLAKLSTLTPEALNELVKRTIRTDRGLLVLVGDAKEIQAQLASLKLPAPKVVKM